MVRCCLALLILLTSSIAGATTYEVGPGKPLANIGDVPWESLNAGDTVLIYARPTPYREKWVISRAGTAIAPITVRGMPDGSGNLPVISGENATTRLQLNYTNEQRGVIKIGTASPDVLPQYIVIEDLDVRSARPGYTFTDDAGTPNVAYNSNAAAIYVERGQHLTIRGNTLHDAGNGLFIGIFNGDTQDVLVEGNYIYDNGIEGSAFEHNNYTAAVGIVFQYNRFGPLRPGCNGNALKDRSIGTVVRYNWIESGNRQLDLVDAEDDPSLITLPAYRTTFVYGNVLIEPDGAGNSQIVHYGGDSGDETIYRKGVLHFYNNTVISTRTGNTTLLRLSTNEETADVRNNVVYVTATGNRLAMLDSAGTLELRSNWFKTGFVSSHSGLTGTITTPVSNVTGTSPGFVDEAGQDFHLLSGSACRDAATALSAAVLPTHDVVRQYVKHQLDEARPVSGTRDIGAYEFTSAGPSPTSGDTPTASRTPTPSLSATRTPTPSGTRTPTPTPTLTATRTATSTATPTVTVAGPTSTAETPTPTATATPTASPLCAPIPIAGCRTPAIAQKATVQFKDKTPDDKDSLVWKWIRGSVTAKADFGSPTTTTIYTVCIYDGVGTVLVDASIPAGGLCNAASPRDCWREKTTGFSYKDKDRTPDGVFTLTLREGLVAGQAKIILKGKGGLLDDVALPLTQPLTVQLVNDVGACWEAVYSAPATRNTAGPPGQFKDRAD